MIVTIHQPDFMPWLGFFKKIADAVIWIVLDHVYSNPRDAASWLRRVKILANNCPFWLSLPIKKPKSGSLKTPINRLEYNFSQSKLISERLKTIDQSYRRSRNFDKIFFTEKQLLRKNFKIPLKEPGKELFFQFFSS